MCVWQTLTYHFAEEIRWHAPTKRRIFARSWTFGCFSFFCQLMGLPNYETLKIRAYKSLHFYAQLRGGGSNLGCLTLPFPFPIPFPSAIRTLPFPSPYYPVVPHHLHCHISCFEAAPASESHSAPVSRFSHWLWLNDTVKNVKNI